MLRATLTSLLARKLRLLLSGTAVVLGVAFVSGALVLTSTLERVFDELFASVSQGTDVEVRGASTVDSAVGDLRRTVPASVLDEVRAVEGVQAVSPDIEGYAQVLRPDGTAYTTGAAPNFGVNYDPDPALSPFTLRAGAAPTGPGELALDAATAAATGHAVGDTVRVVLRDGPAEGRLTGIFGFGDNDNLGGASFVAFDTATAQQLVGRPGEYDAVRIAAAEGVSPEQLRERVAAVLPEGVEAATGEQSAADDSAAIKEQLGFVSTFLLVFAGVALFVGAFLIVNTFAMLLAQRTKELALLRALGANQGQVTRSVLVEALVVGVVASVLGVAAGIGVAAGLRVLMSSFGGTLPDGPLVVEPGAIVTGLVVGIGVTLAAALLPARRAAKVPPVAAMRDATLPEASTRRSTIAGAALLAVGVTGIGVGLTGQLALLGLGALAAFTGVSLLAPLLARPVARVVGRPLARGAAGRLGRLNAMRSPKRTATTAAALTVGIALVSAVSVLGASLTRSVEAVVDQGLAADIVVQAPQPTLLPPAVADRLREVDGVASVEPLRAEQAMVGGDGEATSGTFLTAIRPEVLGTSLRMEAETGDPQALAPGTTALSSDTAEALGVRTGDVLTVQPANGPPLSLQVVGTFAPSELLGDVVVDLSVSQRFSQALDAVLLVGLAEGAEPSVVQAALESAGAAFPGVRVMDRDAFVGDTVEQVEQITAFITVLLVLSVLIAVLGIVNTLALSVIERTRELGLLRAVGLSRAQTRRMVRVEAVVVAVFGAVLGLGVGTLLGIAFQRALVGQGITELALPYGRLGTVLVAAAVAGVVAAILPARRAARLDVLRAISTA